jgi:hypothetical protein
LWVWGLDGSIFGFGNYFSISQLENADPNAEMIVRELEMFSTAANFFLVVFSNILFK